jgi:RNA polymerase sigma factor (sigma-70 family)
MNLQEAVPATKAWANACHSIAQVAPSDERLLVAQAKSGRSNAFGELYQRHRPRIYRTALRILRNQEDAEDAAQRSFQRAFTNLGRFRGDSTFSTWLTRIAINEALMLLRRRRTHAPLFEDRNDAGLSCDLDLADNGPTPEEILARNEQRAAVLHAVSKLRESLRTVVVHELQGLTIAETARNLGLSVAAVKGRHFHARRHLRRNLEGMNPEPTTEFCSGCVVGNSEIETIRSGSPACR